MKGRTIRLFLVDGTPTGILTAEIINWTGKVIVAPRTKLAELAKRDEVKRTGIYCLVGPDPESTTRDRVYIGEGDSVLTRLTSHDKTEVKDFWNRAVVVISKDDNITKSHGRYLESRLITMTSESDRATLDNSTNPGCPPLPEPDVADMEYFLDQMQMVFPVLGFAFLQPKPEVRRMQSEDSASPMFTINSVGIEATAREVDGEFVVLKGSTTRKESGAIWVGSIPVL